MDNSARPPVIPPVSEPSSSSQHFSFEYQVDSDYEVRGSGSIRGDTLLNPSEVAFQHTSDHLSANPSGSRSPTLSHGNSDDEDQHDPTEDTVINTRESFMHNSREESRIVSVGGLFRTPRVPQYFRNFQYGKLLNKFWNHPHAQCRTVIELPKSANVLKLWQWEIFNCVLAICMLGSMYSILLHYDGQSLPDWGTTINLSTLIALMATILRIMLAFVVSEIIGQAKWDYFAEGARPKTIAPVRRLIETNRFNDASQGMLGAVKLLPTIIWDPATLTAVMVMILSLGTGSFMQQAIQSQSCQFLVDSAHASLPVSRKILDQSVRYSDRSTAALSALAPDSEEIGIITSVECPTGNCTFLNSIDGVYSTLGICSSCTDTSSLITSTENTCDGEACASQATRMRSSNVTLPNGMLVLDHTVSPTYSGSQLLVSSQHGLDWAGDLVSQDMKAFSQWAVANVTILAPNQFPTISGHPDHVAASCTMYHCLRSYTGSVRSGELNEVLVGTAPAVPDVADAIQTWPYSSVNIEEEISTGGIDALQRLFQTYNVAGTVYFSAVQSPCFVNGTVWTKESESSALEMQLLRVVHADPDPNGTRRFTIENTTAPAECIYSVEGFAVSGMTESLLNGNCSVWHYDPKDQIDCGQTFWLASFLDDNGTTAASIIKRIEGFTDRLSNKMRMGFLNDPETVSGQVFQVTVCTKIYYNWLAFPAVLVAVTSGLLAWTMFRSSRRQGRVMVWKTSILPFLFYGERFVVQNGEDVSADSTERLRRAEGAKEPLLDLDQMETEAKQRKVRFDMFD